MEHTIDLKFYIDALAQAQNRPEQFIWECFEQHWHGSSERFNARHAPLLVAFQRMAYNPIKFYKYLDVANRSIMETWLTATAIKTQEMLEHESRK